MEKINISKLKELGFTEESTHFYKKVGELTDRFTTTIIFDKEEEKFLFTRFFSSRVKLITENDILINHNELHTGAKEEWLKIKEIMGVEVE